MERKILGSADGLCQSIPSRKTLKDLSGRLGCASTQYQSVRAGRDKHGGIMPPATMAEVRQLRHLRRKKPEGANTAPGKSCASINSNALWAMYEWEPVAGQFQRCLLKYTCSQKWWQVTQSEKKKSEKKLCQHRWPADAPQPPCAQPLWALPEGGKLSCPKSEVLHQGYWALQSPIYTSWDLQRSLWQYLYAEMTRFCPSPIVVQGIYDLFCWFFVCGGFFGFLQVFSFQYKTQLAQGRDSWWKWEQGRIILFPRLDTVKG